MNRDCAEPGEIAGQSICGMTFAGDCADYTPDVSPFACESRRGEADNLDGATGDGGAGEAGDLLGGYYKKCHSSSTTGRWPRSSARYDQVITVFVSPAS